MLEEAEEFEGPGTNYDAWTNPGGLEGHRPP